MATTDFCDGDYLGAYRRFLEHFVANVSQDDQLPVRMACREVRECEVAGEIADISLKHLNQRICPPSLQAYLVKMVKEECKILFQKQPEECGYRPQEKCFSPLKLMQAVTNKVNEICQRYLDNSRLALLPPPPSTPLPLASSYAIKNRRRKMEDRSVVLHDLHTMFSIKNDAVVNYYAVFDGHGGQEAATYCAAHLHQYLIESPYYPADPELALRDAFHTTDSRFIECDDTKNSGATAVCALLYDKTLYIAWAGDSQAALIKNGRGINLTIPHKPERPDEKLRIESLGGEVIYFGSWRVNGILNVSRALGDAKYKPFVSGEPDIKRIELDGTEDFLIVACDGFWERATEDIVASLLYEYVSSSHCDYNLASVALVNWAKQNFSEDNISVIVVFLTPPAEIAAKSFFDPRPLPQSTNMEQPGYQDTQQTVTNPAPYDLDYGFSKQPAQVDPASLQLQHTNGNDNEPSLFLPGQNLLEPVNGRHRPKPPRYNDDDDDDEEEEDEDDEEDVDLGPETNVDLVDEVPEEFGKLDQAMGQNYPDEFLIKMPVKTEDDDFPMEIKQLNELIAEADNVADSEDSEDEWNYYRPGENNKQQQQQQQQQQQNNANANLNSNSIASSNPSQKDPALVEKPDRCDEEKEPCSPKSCEDDDDSDDNSQHHPEDQHLQQQQQEEEHAAEVDVDVDVGIDIAAATATAIATLQEDIEGESEDVVTAEYDELHEQEIIAAKERESSAQQELKEVDTEAESATIPEEDFPYDKEAEQLDEHQFTDQLDEHQLSDKPDEHQLSDKLDEHQLSEKLDEHPLTEQLDEHQLTVQLDEHQFADQLKEEHFGKPQEPEEQEQQQQQPEQEPLQQQQQNLAEIEHKREPDTEEEDDDMESHLNPDAAEFVPTSATTPPPLIPQLVTQMESDLVAGSPLKQSQRALKNRKIPSEQEFQDEVCRRPAEIDDSAASDISNGENNLQSPLSATNNLIGGFEDEGQRTVINPLNLDESEISSTRAEFGDESTANYSVASEFYKTGLSTIDSSFTGSERGADFDFSLSKDPMATSMTPGDFKAAFEQELDLNKVHELNDDDLTAGDVQNGTMEEKTDKIVIQYDDGDFTMETTERKFVKSQDGDELLTEKIELDFENFVPVQQQNAEVFSAIVEEKESSKNEDMFMNLRNSEQDGGYEFEQDNKEERNLIDTEQQQSERNIIDTEQQSERNFIDTEPQHSESNLIDTEEKESERVASADNEKVEGFSIDDAPVYASNNPFSSEYVPASELREENNVQNLVDDLQNVALEKEEPKQQEPQQLEDSPALTPEEEREMQRSIHDVVMQNPLDLNFGATSAEQKIDEPVLVSPIKEPEVMSSKFEEEDLMSKSVEALQLQDTNQKYIEQDEFFLKTNHVEDLSPVSNENIVDEPQENVADEVHEPVAESLERKSINLSESLQEFTGLEEQLSPKHEVKDNDVEPPQVLKENLVDEQKDVEEVKAPSPVPEPKVEESPLVTNEAPAPVSNEIQEKVEAAAAEVTAASAAVTTAVAAAAVAAATAAATAAASKPAATKSATAVSRASKPAGASKLGAKSTTPTSPTKTGVAGKTGATSTAAKKPTTAATSTPRAKPATGAATKTAASAASKAPARAPVAPKTAPGAAAKTTTRAASTTASAAPRAKPPSSVASKIGGSGSAAERKPPLPAATNGEVKPPPIGRCAPPPKPKPPAGAASKTGGLVNKTSSTAGRASTGATTAAALGKARPTSAATSAKPATSRLSSSNATGSTNSTGSAAARPKTAPTSTLNATAKSKIVGTGAAGAKSPMIDKQIKETANKQISSARGTGAASATKSRLSSVTSSSTTTAAKRTSLVQKQTVASVAASPTKKPAPIAKPGSKTSGAAASKVNSKVSSTTKTGSATSGATATAKILQNGVCPEAEKNATLEVSTNENNSGATTTPATTNIEEDIPKKDVSPIEPVTDNQLITAE